MICQTLAVSLLLGTLRKSFWFIYLLILIFIGGILVLFIYVTSIFPNEKFINGNYGLLMWVTLTAVSLITYIILFNIVPNILELTNSISINRLLIPSLKIFSSKTRLILIFIVNYLFYCIIVVIKITNFFRGPLRKIN